MKILEINCSARVSGLVSRRLANEFIGLLKKRFFDAEVTSRNINIPDQFMPEEIRGKSIETAETKLTKLAADWTKEF